MTCKTQDREKLRTMSSDLALFACSLPLSFVLLRLAWGRRHALLVLLLLLDVLLSLVASMGSWLRKSRPPCVDRSARPIGPPGGS